MGSWAVGGWTKTRPVSLGLLPSGPDPVGERYVLRQPPGAYVDQDAAPRKGRPAEGVSQLEFRVWAESGATRCASGRARVRAKAVVPWGLQNRLHRSERAQIEARSGDSRDAGFLKIRQTRLERRELE
jgi:hypothetical protein